MIPQFLSERVMRERLAELGHAVEFGCELGRLRTGCRGCVCAHSSASTAKNEIRARYLIGADGGRSFIRHALDIDFPGKTLGVRAVVADVALTGLDRDAVAYSSIPNRWRRRLSRLCPLAGTDLFQLQAPDSARR